MESVVFTFLGRDITIGTLLIPIFAAGIGLLTNWQAVQMMFLPIKWFGWKMPFKLFGFPVFGWQGVIPSKAAKMGSIAVDTGLAKLGTMTEFYQTLDPDKMAERVVEVASDDIHALIDQIIQEQYPDLWQSAPNRVKALVHQRVAAKMPGIVRAVMDDIGKNVDRLVDLKLMVIRYLEANPKLINKIFQEVGAKEFRFIVWSGLWMGFLLGFIPMVAWIFYPQWWTVPVGGAAVGYATNWIALKVIFLPTNPIQVGPIRLHGLFLRRQPEVAEAYSDIIAYEILTLSNVAHAMINGPDGDRTKRLIADVLAPVVDETVGIARPLVKAATRGKYDTIVAGISEGAVGHTIGGLQDEEFGRERAKPMQELLANRMRDLSYKDFTLMLRSAFQEDEWMLIVVGAILGFAAGVVQLFLTL